MRIKGWCVLVLVALLGAMPVMGQEVAGGGGTPTQVNGAGQWEVLWENAINDTVSGPTQAQILTAPFSAESTAVLYVSNLESCALLVSWVPGAPVDTTLIHSFAFEIRGHYNTTQTAADSLKHGVWTRWFGVGNSTLPDSVGQMWNAALTGGRSGEFLVVFDPKTYVPSAFRSWAPPPVRWIPLFGQRSEAFQAPFMSIKVRQLRPLGQPNDRIRVTVVGIRKK